MEAKGRTAFGVAVVAVALLGAGAWLVSRTDWERHRPVARDQQNAGERVYRARCAACHDPGADAPELTPARLAAHTSALRLYTYIRTTQPADDPGSLGEADYWDVTAFLLGSRGLVPPELEVSAGSAERIRLRAP